MAMHIALAWPQRQVLDGCCLMAARGREGNERCCGLVR